MKAAILEHAPGDLVIDDVTIDSPAADEVLVRVVACGLCHSDLHILEASLPTALPSVLGHECAGLVEAVGRDVTTVAVGDSVVTCTAQFCGTCVRCASGETWLCPNRRAIGRGVDNAPMRWGDRALHAMGSLGGLAEMMIVHQNALVAVPPEVPADRAALLGCAVLTGVGSVLNGARVRPGESVVVIGCGGVGLNVVQGARLAGAERIIAIDRLPAKLELARIFGATDVIDATLEGGPTERVRELTGDGVDHAFDVVGLSTTTAQAVEMIRPGRTAYVVGVPATGTSIEVPAPPMVFREKGLRGLLMGSSRFVHDIPMLASLYLQGRLELDALVAEHLTLDAVNGGYERLRTGSDARSVVMFDQ